MVTVPNSKQLKVNRPENTILLNDKKSNVTFRRTIDPNWTKRSDELFSDVVKAKRHFDYYVEKIGEAEQKHATSVDSMKKQKTKQDLEYCKENLKIANKNLVEKSNHFADHHKVKL